VGGLAAVGVWRVTAYEAGAAVTSIGSGRGWQPGEILIAWTTTVGGGSLTSIRSHMAAAAARLAEMTEGVDRPGLATVRSQLRAADVSVTRAADGLSRWTHAGLRLVAIGVGSWTAAAVSGQLIGLSSGWTVAVTAVVAAGVLGVLAMLIKRLTARANRRRTTPTGSAPIAARIDVSPTVEILALLRKARDGLMMAMRGRLAGHRLGYLARTAAGFDWLRRRDRRLRWMSLADRQLCEAICLVELWPAARVGQP